jgi:hypothetical protein
MAQSIYEGYPSEPEPIIAGNINVLARPQIRTRKKTDDSIVVDPTGPIVSTLIVTTLTKTIDGISRDINLPLLSANGKTIYTKTQAWEQYKKDGLHLGIFEREKKSYKSSSGLLESKFIAVIAAEKLSELEKIRVESFARLNLSEYSNGNDYSIADTTDIQDIISIFNITGLRRNESETLARRMTSLTVSYSDKASTEVSVQYLDTDYSLTGSGVIGGNVDEDRRYFDLRRDVIYRGRPYEIGEVSTAPGTGGSPVVNIRCWPKNVQLMKRDKKPELIAGTNGFEYAQSVARRYGMPFVGQKTGKQQALFKARTSSGADSSVWTVLTEAAGQNQYQLFEVDGQLIYGSLQWMLWRFGLSSRVSPKGITQKYIELFYNPILTDNGAVNTLVETPVGTFGTAASSLVYDNTGIAKGDLQTRVDSKAFELTTWPDIRRSENDGLEGDGTATLKSPNGRLIRPGHTVYFSSVPGFFRGGYVVNGVSFSEFDSQPVQINFSTPQKPKDQKKPAE